MTDALVVHVNRSTHHAIEPASDSFETDGPFVVQLRNHGEGSHVHCSLHGELANAGTVTDDNPFLEPDDVLELPVEVGTDLRPARGTLEISTGYGRESTTVDVLVRESGSIPTSPIEPEAGESAGGRDSNVPAASRSGDGPVASRAGDGPAPSRSGSAPADSSVPSVDALREALPRLDAGTALLAALALLALLIALAAWQLLEGIAVLLAVLVVVATVVGAGVALLRA